MHDLPLSAARLRSAARLFATLPVNPSRDRYLGIGGQHELEAWACLVEGRPTQALAAWHKARGSYARSAKRAAAADRARLACVDPNAAAPVPPSDIVCRAVGLPLPDESIWAELWERAWTAHKESAGAKSEPASAVTSQLTLTELPHDIVWRQPMNMSAEAAEPNARLSASEGSGSKSSTLKITEDSESIIPESMGTPPFVLEHGIAWLRPWGGVDPILHRGVTLPAAGRLDVQLQRGLTPDSAPLSLLLVAAGGDATAESAHSVVARIRVYATTETGVIGIYACVRINVVCRADRTLTASATTDGVEGAAIRVEIQSTDSPPDAATLAGELRQLRDRARQLRRYARGVKEAGVIGALHIVGGMLTSSDLQRPVQADGSDVDRQHAYGRLLEFEVAIDAFEDELDLARVDRSKSPPPPPFPTTDPDRLLFLARWFAGEAPMPEAAPAVVERRAKPEAVPWQPAERGTTPAEGLSQPPPAARARRAWLPWSIAASLLLVVLGPVVSKDLRVSIKTVMLHRQMLPNVTPGHVPQPVGPPQVLAPLQFADTIAGPNQLQLLAPLALTGIPAAAPVVLDPSTPESRAAAASEPLKEPAAAAVSETPRRNPFANTDDAMAVQKFLAAAGQYRGEIDGRFGQNSRRALLTWKSSKDLPANEIWDALTEQRMFGP